MDEEFSSDPSQLLEAASDFAYQPADAMNSGALSDTSAQEFLTRFPLPAIISALQTNADYPGLENALVDCLERIFRTKYGASLIPHYMPFILVGLGANSQKVRRLACVAISCLLENTDKRIAVQLVLQHGVYPLLLSCLIDGDEQVATASTDAIKNMVGYQEGMGIVIPASVNEATHLGNLAAKCSSLGRVRVLALIVRLFSISSSVASEVSRSNLLSLLEAEVKNTNDTLVTLNVLELLYEITSGAAESILRSRAMMIAGRLLSKENAFAFIDESSVRTVLSAIDRRFEFMGQEADECECALEALGQIGSSFQGATILLATTPPTARHVVDAAFDRQQHGKQLLAAVFPLLLGCLALLGNIAGETRIENTMVLSSSAEENLRSLTYDKASRTSKLTPSGLLLSVLQQDSEIRIAVSYIGGNLSQLSVQAAVSFFCALVLLKGHHAEDISLHPFDVQFICGFCVIHVLAICVRSQLQSSLGMPFVAKLAEMLGYRLISGLVARPWCLTEIISRQEIIDIVTNTYTETTKIGMEARHRCCEAIYSVFSSSTKLLSDPSFADMASKLQEAIRRGPYGARKRTEAQPVVATADRF
ncbi:hypothetical protein DH2020_033469 [Rehmannia glutinosa]|uniref:ARM repeat superfamily protein n=1 Tax=Rehmannia glutinosa TaxID=99300 RepID=A0ABR0VF82_REHGL